MKIRSVIYWVACLFIATYAAGRAVASAPEIEATVTPASLSVASLLAIPDAARSVLLFMGIIAVAFTYHRAWTNFRSGPTA
jgi:hypothetical protein